MFYRERIIIGELFRFQAEKEEEMERENSERGNFVSESVSFE